MKAYLKLLLLLAATTWLITLNRLPELILITAACLIALRRRPGRTARIKFLLPVLAIMLLVQAVSGSWQRALTSWLKLVNLSLAVLIYTSYSPVKELVRVFGFLGGQGRLLFTLTFNLLPIILKEFQVISLVQKSRGRYRFNPLPVFVPLLHRTLKRAEQLALVLSLSAK